MKKTTLISLVAGGCLVICAIVILLLTKPWAGAKQVTAQDLLLTGQKYQQEQDSEKGIDAYLDALSIDSTLEEAYLGLAELYEDEPAYQIASLEIAKDKLEPKKADEFQKQIDDIYISLEYEDYTVEELKANVEEAKNELTKAIEDRGEEGIKTPVEDITPAGLSEKEGTYTGPDSGSGLFGGGGSDGAGINGGGEGGGLGGSGVGNGGSNTAPVLDAITVFGTPLSKWSYSDLLSECRSRTDFINYNAGEYCSEEGSVGNNTYYMLNNDGGLQIQPSGQGYIFLAYSWGFMLISEDGTTGEVDYPSDLFTNEIYLQSGDNCQVQLLDSNRIAMKFK